MRVVRTAALAVAAVTIATAQTPKLSRDWPSHGHDAGALRHRLADKAHRKASPHPTRVPHLDNRPRRRS
jgi:hypothetical protein